MRRSDRKRRSKALNIAPPAKLMSALGILLLGSVLPLYGELPLGLSLTISFLFAVHLLVQRYTRLRPGRFVILCLTFFSIWMVVHQFHTLFGYQAGIALLAVLIALKLLETRSERDFFVAVILGLIILVSQFLLNQSMYLALYALLVVLGLLALLIRHNRSVPTSISYLVRLSSLILVQALPLVVIMFLLFPRLSSPLWDLKLGPTQGVTGLSDSMAPGSVNKLIKSRETAFRAEFFGPFPDKTLLYWRGPILWRTDGFRWYGNGVDDQGEANLDLVESGEDGVYEYRLILEPHGKHWVLALDLPVHAPKETHLTADFQLLSLKPVNHRKQYLLKSVTSLPTTDITDAERIAALQLPDRVSSRTLSLVKNWSEHAQTHEAIVRSALNYFNKEGFIYTLSPPRLTGDTTDMFLFETRAGFCEHYASVFSLLMRIAGIPSRVVTGYLGGEYNVLGNYLIVRQSDAHAWSEVWLEGQGWVRIDPTAAIAPQRILEQILIEEEVDGAPISFRVYDSGILSGMFRRIRLSLDALNTQWHIWVLGYDNRHQTRLLNWFGLNRLDTYQIGMLMLILLAMTVVLFIYLMQRMEGKRSDDPLTGLYDLFCQRLSALGIVREKYEGPQDFAERATRLRADLGVDIKFISALYIQLKYSGRASSRQLEKLRERIRGFLPKRM